MRVATDLFSTDPLKTAVARSQDLLAQQVGSIQEVMQQPLNNLNQLAARTSHMVAAGAQGFQEHIHTVSSHTVVDSIHGVASQVPQRIASQLHGLQSTVVRTVQSLTSANAEARADIQQLGRTLQDLLGRHNLLETSLSSGAREALHSMAETASPLPEYVITELRESKALVICVGHCAKHELLQLRTLISRAASSGVALELLALWGLVHTTISTAIPAEELKALTTTAFESVQGDAVAAMKAVGSILQVAITSSMALAAAVSVEFQGAVKSMAESGVQLSSHMQDELVANAKLIGAALPSEQLQQLQAHLVQTVGAEYEGLQRFGEQLKQATAGATPVVNVLAEGLKSVVYNNPFTALMSKADASVDTLMAQSRAAVNETVSAITNGISSSVGCGCIASLASSLPLLLRIEILRDFCQTASLFFTNLYAVVESQKNSSLIRGTQLFFQSLFNIISADFAALWASSREVLIDAGFGLLLFMIVITYVAYVWFALSGRHLHRRSEEIRHGHEASSWAELADKKHLRLRIFTAVITLCLSVYLPLTRVCLEIVAAMIIESSYSTAQLATMDVVSPSTLAILGRYGSVTWLWFLLQIGAIALVITYTIPLPVLLVKAISENKPTGSPENPLITYDVDGEQIAFDDKVYARLVASDPSQLRCPYRSLYAGFEQRWSHYKVFQLLFKVALIVPLILTQHRGIRSILTTVIYSLILLLTSYGTPFNDPLNNVMEISGKIAGLVTCVGGLLLAYFSTNDRVQVVVGFLVNAVNAVNLVVMLVIVFFGIPKTRLWIKNRLGTLTFSDTVCDILDGPSHKIIPHWDLEKEVKHRVWHHFWHALLLSLDNKKEREKVIQRLSYLQRAVTESGLENVKRHWAGHADPYIACMRLATRRLLEGVDVYWDDARGARDGVLDSASYFGKMYVRPYPFHCVVVYDDSDDEAIIREDKFAIFFFMNFSPQVLAKRALRQRLRALSEDEVGIHFPFARQESVTVEDGTETVTTTDAEGKTHTATKTRYSTVSFTCFYNVGVIRVASNSTKHEMAAGFHVTMVYNDGYGEAIAPHTGKVHPQTNRQVVMGPDHLGLTPEMQESPQLRMIFQQTHNRWEPGVQKLVEKHHQYRCKLIERHEQANGVLGDGFWYFVFNNPKLSRYQLVHYLKTEEINPVLRKLPETHAASLDFLYQRLGFVNSHPACRLWYVFWDDVVARNGSMKKLVPLSRELDPAQPSSIAYRVMKRDELVQWLKERKVYGRPFAWQTLLLGRRCLFHERMLQVLYERMHSFMEPSAVPVKSRGNRVCCW